jgi:hypothetical protein
MHEKARQLNGRALDGGSRVLIVGSSALIHGGDAGNTPTLAMNHLLGFQEFIEGHKAHRVAAFVELLSPVTSTR